MEEVQEKERYHSGREGRVLLRNPSRQILRDSHEVLLVKRLTGPVASFVV